MTEGPLTLLLLALVAGPSPAPPAPAPAPTAAPAPAAPAADPGATDPAGDIATAEDPSGSVTRYNFTGLDIDGDLRTPALLNFLARIGGEFEAAGVPHRSFMPELQASTMEDAL